MKKIVCVILCLILVVACFAGCHKATKYPDPIALVIVAGKHANANRYTEEMLGDARQLIQQSIEQTNDASGYHAKAHINVIVSDGNPQAVRMLSNGESILECSASSRSAFEDGKNRIVNDVMEFLLSDDLKADDEQVDLLKAIDQAQKILNSERNLEHHLLIIDTGITTTGALNMLNADFNIEKKDAKEMLPLLKDYIPNLTGTKISFLGLGNVGASQRLPDSNTAQNNLLDLWDAILTTEGGGELDYALQISSSQGDPIWNTEDEEAEGVGYPYVGTVNYTEIKMSVSPGDEGALAVPFNTNDLGFEPNKATFRYPEQAYNALNSIQEPLSKVLVETDYKIYVVGSIAKTKSDREVATSEVSKGRADAIVNLLVEKYNVPKDRIVAIDAGTHEFSWRNANEDNGPRQENRVVMIMSENAVKLVAELKDAGLVP